MPHGLEEAYLRSLVLQQQCRAEARLRTTLQAQTARAADRRAATARSPRLSVNVPVKSMPKAAVKVPAAAATAPPADSWSELAAWLDNHIAARKAARKVNPRSPHPMHKGA